MQEISIIILTKNSSRTITDVLNNIFLQTCNYLIKVYVIDSGSTDNTICLCSAYNVKLSYISSSKFNYGTTRNEAISKLTSDYVVFLSSDSIPFNEFWLDNLIKPLNDNIELAGVFSKQIVNPKVGAKIDETIMLHTTFGDESILYTNKSKNIIFSNASSAIRTELLQKYKFKEISWAEDRIWAEEIVQKGYNIFYNPKSIVYHSHNYNKKELFRRSINNGKSKDISKIKINFINTLKNILDLSNLYHVYFKYIEDLRSRGDNSRFKFSSFIQLSIFNAVNQFGNFIGLFKLKKDYSQK